MTLDDIAVDAPVHALRPDFAVLAVIGTSLAGGAGDERSEATLLAAEDAARTGAAATHPHVEAWREAYRAFGARPQRTAPSVDALRRRAAAGPLPRVNWLVDLYNAISVIHALPVGGEDFSAFVGPLRLVRATGTEPFETIKDGRPHVEYAEPGEVVWTDDRGVTCRRWNWRQGSRTRLHPTSTAALFLFERLEPMSLEALEGAADALMVAVRRRCPDALFEHRRLGPLV